MTVLTPMAMIAALIGAFLVYAGARHQRITPKGGKRPVLMWIGWALLAIALAALLAGFDAPAAIFTWMTLMMLVWSTIPLALALRDQRRKES